MKNAGTCCGWSVHDVCGGDGGNEGGGAKVENGDEAFVMMMGAIVVSMMVS